MVRKVCSIARLATVTERPRWRFLPVCRAAKPGIKQFRLGLCRKEVAALGQRDDDVAAAETTRYTFSPVTIRGPRPLTGVSDALRSQAHDRKGNSAAEVPTRRPYAWDELLAECDACYAGGQAPSTKLEEARNMMKSLIALYSRCSVLLSYLQSPFLLWVRLYWGWQFATTGWGKMHNMA